MPKCVFFTKSLVEKVPSNFSVLKQITIEYLERKLNPEPLMEKTSVIVFIFSPLIFVDEN